MERIEKILSKQREFQRTVGFPIDSVAEADRNDLSEKYIFKLIEEAVELRKEIPSVINPWSKKQKQADIQRVKEEFSDILLFLMNIALVWRFTPNEILEMLEDVQKRNFLSLKTKKMNLLNSDILKIPGKVSGVGQGNLSPKYVFIGMNPGQDITHGYKFWSNQEDGSSKILLPALKKLGVIDDCYFTNIVKCTTTDNKEPDEATFNFYNEFLMQEIGILKIDNPDMQIIAMGKWTSKKTGYPGIAHPASVMYGSTDEKTYKDKIWEAIK